MTPGQLNIRVMWLYDWAAKLSRPDRTSLCSEIVPSRSFAPDPNNYRIGARPLINGLGKAKLPDNRRVKGFLELLSIGDNSRVTH